MARYILLPFTVDPADLREESFEYLRAVFPNWTAASGSLTTVLIEANADMAGDIAQSLSQVPDEIFRYFGRSLAGLPPVNGATASGTVNFTAIDDAGYTIPDGTQLAGINPAGEQIAFITLGEALIDPGETTVLAVPVQAVEDGTAGNDVTGDVSLLDPLDFIDTAVFDQTTTGGADRESDADYLDRLRLELQLQTPRPILPRDFEILARRIPGVARAVALDGFNPSDSSTGNARMIAIAAIDDQGEPVDSETEDELAAYLDALREVNFIINVITPVITPVDIEYEASAYPGWDTGSVQTAIDTALADYLSGETWGIPPVGDDRLWINETKVRVNDVVEVIKRVDGVRYVGTVEIEGSASDFTLPGAVALPEPGSITGTVAATTYS